MEIIFSIILFVAGLAILIKGSGFFVGSSAFVARHFGVSRLIIGLTLVSMGTSLPELGASVYASYAGEGEIAVGNVVGSNIANIALVLGACILLRQITIKKKMIRRDGLIMLGVTLLFIFLVIGGVKRWEGLILMVIFATYILLLYKHNKTDKEDEELCELSDRFCPKESSLKVEIVKLTIGCIGVFLGSKLLVDSAVDIAQTFSISQSVIGSTLIAFGTSVPELAVSMTAILKRLEDISIGNIIGSNIFNILWVIGAAALVANLAVDEILLYTNIPIMLSVSALLLIFMAVRGKLERWQGIIFVAIYVVFIFLNFW
jgi:cation:H+ antiporter